MNKLSFTKRLNILTSITAKLLITIKLTPIFFIRAAEHMGVSNLTGKQLKNMKDLAISDHLLQCNSTIDFHNFDVLATDVSKFNLLVKESLLTKRDNPVLNRITKSLPL